MSAHTPGPWHVGGHQQCTLYDRFGQRLAISFEGVMVAQRSDAECKANARLIASAPAMLDALRDLCDQAERSLDYRPEFREALARGLAAINEATKEQP